MTGTVVRVLRDEGRERQSVSRFSKLLHLSGYMGDAMVNTPGAVAQRVREVLDQKD
jgi:hypothetical protein